MYSTDCNAQAKRQPWRNSESSPAAALAPEPLEVLGFAVYIIDALVIRSTRNFILSRLSPQVPLIDWISDTLSQEYTNLQSTGCPHRSLKVSHFEASVVTPKQHRYLLNIVYVCANNLEHQHTVMRIAASPFAAACSM